MSIQEFNLEIFQKTLRNLISEFHMPGDEVTSIKVILPKAWATKKVKTEGIPYIFSTLDSVEIIVDYLDPDTGQKINYTGLIMQAPKI